jgi:hypothetical protein
MSIIEILLVLSWPISGIAAVAWASYQDNEEFKIFDSGMFFGIFTGWILFFMVLLVSLSYLPSSFDRINITLVKKRNPNTHNTKNKVK